MVLLLRNEGKNWYEAPCCCFLVDVHCGFRVGSGCFSEASTTAVGAAKRSMSAGHIANRCTAVSSLAGAVGGGGGGVAGPLEGQLQMTCQSVPHLNHLQITCQSLSLPDAHHIQYERRRWCRPTENTASIDTACLLYVTHSHCMQHTGNPPCSWCLMYTAQQVRRVSSDTALKGGGGGLENTTKKERHLGINGVGILTHAAGLQINAPCQTYVSPFPETGQR